MRRKQKIKIAYLVTIFMICSIGVYIILSNLNDNIVFFYPPSQISKITSSNTKSRVGGIVKEGSMINYNKTKIRFTITDNLSDLHIEYDGILPALFREKQGIVAEGFLVSNDLFVASKLLAKHDENYMPPNITATQNKAPISKKNFTIYSQNIQKYE